MGTARMGQLQTFAQSMILRYLVEHAPGREYNLHPRSTALDPP
jgi:hypothetical protein